MQQHHHHSPPRKSALRKLRILLGLAIVCAGWAWVLQSPAQHGAAPATQMAASHPV